MVSMNMLHRRMQNCKGKGVKMVSMNLLWREKYVEMWESENFENSTQKWFLWKCYIEESKNVRKWKLWERETKVGFLTEQDEKSCPGHISPFPMDIFTRTEILTKHYSLQTL